MLVRYGSMNFSGRVNLKGRSFIDVRCGSMNPKGVFRHKFGPSKYTFFFFNGPLRLCFTSNEVVVSCVRSGSMNLHGCFRLQ